MANHSQPFTPCKQAAARANQGFGYVCCSPETCAKLNRCQYKFAEDRQRGLSAWKYHDRED